jgi:hypothetical protein
MCERADELEMSLPPIARLQLRQQQFEAGVRNDVNVGAQQ